MLVALTEELRRRRMIIPGVSVVERLAAEAIHTAEKTAVQCLEPTFVSPGATWNQSIDFTELFLTGSRVGTHHPQLTSRSAQFFASGIAH